MTESDAIVFLKERGWTVVRQKSAELTRQKLAVARRELEFEQRMSDSTRQWAQQAFDEQRRLADRCEHLYGLASKYGATPEELRGNA